MQKYFEKIKERLEEKMNHSFNQRYKAFAESIEIVNQVAEECINCSTDTSTDDGWIPCSEKLPEQGDEYYPMCLVSLENGDVCLGVYRYDESAWYTRMSEGEEVYSTEHKVLSWQPLPAPYQPKGEE